MSESPPLNGHYTEWKGYLRASRGPVPKVLIKKAPFAYILAAVIAQRARWNDNYFNPDNLALGEAEIGDHDEYGMTRSQYRSALNSLVKWGLVTIRTTNRGTIAKLSDTRLFDPLNLCNSQLDSQRITNQQPASSQPAATNQALNQESSKAINDKASNPTKPSKLSTERKDLADRIEKALGNQWVNDAGKWIDRIKKDSKKSERVIGEVENAAKEGRINTSPAQYAEQMWKEFHSE